MIGWLKRKLRSDIREWQDPQGEDNPMACPEITIEGISAELYNKLLEEATVAGVTFEGTKATVGDVVLNWNYDAPSEKLHYTCLHKPFLYTCGAVDNHIRELIEKSKGAI